MYENRSVFYTNLLQKSYEYVLCDIGDRKGFLWRIMFSKSREKHFTPTHQDELVGSHFVAILADLECDVTSVKVMPVHMPHVIL
jgi:hypothetical protein